jgi:hypothetical protein
VFGSTAVVYGAFINTSLISDQGTKIWAANFLNSGTISNGSGAFNLWANAATLTNGLVVAGGDLVITCTNLVIGSNTLWAGKQLSLQVTNVLADLGMTNGNICVVGSASGGGTDSGFNAPVKPLAGDLLSTTVTNIAPASKTINNLWAGGDYGYSVLGYSNNLALGRLILDAGLNSKFTFNGTGTSNALYVDYLELRNYATNTDANGNVADLSFGTNLVIYYAQAMVNGISMAGKLNHKNSDHLRWLPAYAGYYSSTNLVYPAGVTNTINAALAASKSIDSDGDGTANGSDATPLFEPAQVAFTLTTALLAFHPGGDQLGVIHDEFAVGELAGADEFRFRHQRAAGVWLAIDQHGLCPGQSGPAEIFPGARGSEHHPSLRPIEFK